MSADLADEELGAEMHIDYGIVEADEASHRLAIQQPPVVEDADVHPSVFPLKSLPDVGLFDQQVWRHSGLKLESVNELFDLWSRVRERAEEIDVSISDRLLGDKNEHRNGSPGA
jgi:hypothetical protein